jgi:hypothetical protein
MGSAGGGVGVGVGVDGVGAGAGSVFVHDTAATDSNAIISTIHNTKYILLFTRFFNFFTSLFI